MHTKDVLYHTSCYKQYTCPKELESLARKDVELENETGNNRTPHQQTFAKLACTTGKIEKTLAEDLNKIMNMTELPSRYSHLLKEEGVDEGNAQSHLLKARLQHQFVSTLSFHCSKQNKTKTCLRSVCV